MSITAWIVGIVFVAAFVGVWVFEFGDAGSDDRDYFDPDD